MGTSVGDWLARSLAERQDTRQGPGLNEHRARGQRALQDHLICPQKPQHASRFVGSGLSFQRPAQLV
jgi:hypothetical protein